MVGRDDVLNAIALNSSMVNGARVVGPAVAGVLVAAVGEGWCFLLNGISYVAVIAGLLLMDIPRTKRESPSHSPLRDAVEGFRFVTRTEPVRRSHPAGTRELCRDAVRRPHARIRAVDSPRRRAAWAR